MISNVKALAAGKRPSLGQANVCAVGAAHARPLKLVALRLALPRQSYLHESLPICTDKTKQNKIGSLK